MNLFDKSIVEFVIKHFDRSYSTLHTFLFISSNDLLKGGAFAVVVWYLWFKAGPAAYEKRVQLLTTLISLFFVMAVSLGLAGLMPFRPRPFLNPEFNFASSDPINLYIGKLSSFPSDHAAFFTSLAVGFLFVSRKIGLMAILYIILFIFFPRLYLGYHYPTDLLSGALIGASITAFFNRSAALKKIIMKRIIPFTNNYPWYFYSIFFLFTYEVAELFTGSREILTFLRGLSKH
jgi:undecaprenyl-diphosphatase